MDLSLRTIRLHFAFVSFYFFIYFLTMLCLCDSKVMLHSYTCDFFASCVQHMPVACMNQHVDHLSCEWPVVLIFENRYKPFMKCSYVGIQ